MSLQEMIRSMSAIPGEISAYYRPLAGEKPAITLNADAPLVAASVIKLPIMAEAFRRFEAGTLDPTAEVVIEHSMKMPSCGALTYMHDGLTATVLDLVTLMIIVSDNTATNALIDILGMDAINRLIEEHGLQGTRLRRKLFDVESSARGIENTITARDMGLLLEMLYTGALISPAASQNMLDILKNQQLNHKIPFFLNCPVAHKTGEDDGITHDAGIVFAKKPFVLVLLSNHVSVPEFERCMQDVAREAYLENC